MISHVLNSLSIDIASNFGVDIYLVRLYLTINFVSFYPSFFWVVGETDRWDCV
jgi:hypothetical protein